jgi:hypothetical protein
MGLKEVVAPSEKGKKTIILFLFLNNDHGVDVSIDNNIFKIY